MGYQYGRAPYNGRRGGAHSAGEAPAVIPVASHSVTGNGSGARPHDHDDGRIQIRMQNNDEIPRRGQDEPRARENIQDQNGNAPPPQPQGEGRRDPPPHPRGNQGEFQQVAEQPQQPNVQTIPGAAVKYTPPVTTLANVKQKEGESLTSYFKRFNAESTLVRGATDETLKILLIAGLRVRADFWKHLQGKDPVSLADVKRRRGLDNKGKDERQPPRAEDVEKTAEVKFQRAGSIRAIFGGHPFVGDSNRALERNAREARHPPLTNIHSLEDRPPKVFKGESADITFKEKESRWVHHPHNDALVITMLIGAMNVHRVFLDNGSSTNILYYSTYKKLGFPDSDMYFEDAHVYGFTGEAVRVMGSVRLPVTLGEGALSVTQMIDFKVLDQDSAHNVLVGRPWLRAFRVITSIHHLMIKFPTPNGVGSLRGSQYESRDCYHKAVKEFRRRRYEGKGLPFEDIKDIHTKPSGEVHAHYFVESPGKEETNTSGNSFLTQGRVSEIRSVEEVVVSHTEKIIQKEVNGEKLEGRSEILQGLDNNFKVDAPQKKDAPLNEVEVDAPPNEDAPSLAALHKDTSRLEVDAPTQEDALSDTKMEVEDPRDFDFDLDPRIPMPAEKTGPAEDTISIPVDRSDPNMIGIDPEVMCHRLNILPNCKGMRQKRRPRLVNMMFKDQIGRTMEVYVDDMLVKSEVTSDHIKHLMEMFNILRRFRMKLNPQKCVFGVESGKFLGFIVNHRGIEANPAKIKALLDMKSPTNVKQVQSLTGRIAALNRFISKSSDRCKEFFKAIKLAGKDFVWTAVLVREEDGQQSPVYYVSKRLHDVKTRYTNMEKLVYALILASRKLRPYFQAHRVEVRTAYPLRQVLHKPESSGRMLKWAVELGQFDLEYVPRTAIKGQALADFLLEFDSEIDDKALVMLHPPHAEESLEEFPHPWWILHVDGAVNNGGAGAGIVLVSPEGHHLMSAIHFKFYATNNDAEYDALINGLKIALEMGVRNLIARSDSELVVNQVNGGFQARGLRTELYLRCTQRLIGMFKEVRLECVPREKNSNADALAKMGSQQEAVLLGSIPLKIQEVPSIPEIETMQVDEALKKTWMTPILAYIRKGTLPEDKFMARRLRYQAARYVIYDEVLYKRGFNQPLLRFGIPYKLVFDNGKQFDSEELRQLCEELKIKKKFAAFIG
ncbi:uncharacterized protein LOC141700792 [Apium graveolens]|uniref:uncharacterized protein LOC141700792 n=1 Tax=Apium graveolens TaxID=4045 RepID=UPI003D7B90E7